MIAEDITQSVFLKLYENFDKIKNIESTNYWIFKTARNNYYNFYKREKRKNGLGENILSNNEDYLEPESYVEIKEIKDIIMNELNKMDTQQKEVYLLKEYGGLSYKEISAALEIDVNLVKSRLYKVRQKLINKISKIV